LIVAPLQPPSAHGESPIAADIRAWPLPADSLPADLVTAFDRLESIHHEQGLDWLQTLASHGVDRDEQSSLWQARSGGSLAALPLRFNPQDRTWRSLSNWYSSIYGPALEGDAGSRLLVDLLRALRGAQGATAIQLSPLDADSPMLHTLEQSLRDAGWRGVHRWCCFGNWTCATEPGNYEAYLAGRPSRLRNTIERKTRAFMRDDRGRLELATGEAGLEAALEGYRAVYADSWKSAEPRADFVPALSRLAARRGWLRLGVAYYDGQPAAAQLWLVANGVAHIFKLAYREGFARLSAGTVLSAHMARYVIEQDRVSGIDYLTGDDDYKRDWMSMRSERHGVAAFNPSRAGGAVALINHSLRAALKRLRSD
jgi:hypothetical protein